MHLSIFILAALVSLVQGSRYGLLRVGSASVEEQSPALDTKANTLMVFDEDLSLAFRQLFGYEAGLSLSMAGGAAQLSLSMMMAQPAQLRMSLGPPGISDDTIEEDGGGQERGNDSEEEDDGHDPLDPLSAIGDRFGPEAIASIAALGGFLLAIAALIGILASLGNICPML